MLASACHDMPFSARALKRNSLSSDTVVKNKLNVV